MINVTKTYLPDISKYMKYVKNIYDSGWITNNGALVRELERRLEEYLDVKHVVLISNGTLALQIAYKLLGLSGKVITTPFSFVATTSSLVWEGLEPVFSDIDAHTLNLNPEHIEEKVDEQVSAIVATHVFGNGCDVEAIDTIAKSHGLSVIYDAAHAFGVQYKGKSILKYGDLSVLSFHATKIFHTIEGGALIIEDDACYHRAKEMINFGIVSAEQITRLGINGKMNEFSAAMGLCILDEMDYILNKRKSAYNYYHQGLDGYVQYPTYNNHCNHNYCYFPIILESEEQVLKVMTALTDIQVAPRRYFYPSLNQLDYVKSQKMPISNDISKRILCLPFYSSLSKDTQDDIMKIIRKIK